jgi:hypothetical protein
MPGNTIGQTTPVPNPNRAAHIHHKAQSQMLLFVRHGIFEVCPTTNGTSEYASTNVNPFAGYGERDSLVLASKKLRSCPACSEYVAF